MRFFDEASAEHYCKGVLGTAFDSVQAFLDRHPRTALLSEGTPAFDDFRSASLLDVERYLLLSTTHYRRALDLLTPTSAPWAHVSLYYGGFFAAKALAGMFGCHIDGGLRIVVDVARSAPGSQQLTITRAAKAPTGVRGSHKIFWDFFYVGSRHLVPRVDPSIRFALLPITTTTWLTDERNEVNYRPDKALAAAVAFAGSFDPARVMSSLPGSMATQLRVTEALAILAAQFGARFGVPHRALAALHKPGGRSDCIRATVLDVSVPNVATQFRGNELAP